MKINNINITETIAKARQLLKDKTKVSAEFAVLFSIILDLFEVLLGRLSKNSKNSSIPPSQDPNREKTPKSDGTKRKPGGQKGRKGTQLKPVENPDEIVSVSVDRKTLPSGHIYKTVGVAKRQVVEFLVKSKVIEYQLEIVADENGKRFTAEGPLGTSRPIQYGTSLKATASYMSIYQLIPYGRVEEYFRDQAGIPISSGTRIIFLFNTIFHKLLKAMDYDLSQEEWIKGCPYCGGNLHQAHYPRSPVGISKEHREYYEDRYSHCCYRCRKRTTSPSLRFFGRRWYPGPLFIWISSLAARGC